MKRILYVIYLQMHIFWKWLSCAVKYRLTEIEVPTFTNMYFLANKWNIDDNIVKQNK